ncbi:hypothetical protein WDL1P1_00687 (plasmid) [Variovorax sp. WDL1]|nr:hypothetical protein WDL1P1_00687 [Variovorax sp. WDL1]
MRGFDQIERLAVLARMGHSNSNGVTDAEATSKLPLLAAPMLMFNNVVSANVKNGTCHRCTGTRRHALVPCDRHRLRQRHVVLPACLGDETCSRENAQNSLFYPMPPRWPSTGVMTACGTTLGTTVATWGQTLSRWFRLS